MQLWTMYELSQELQKKKVKLLIFSSGVKETQCCQIPRAGIKRVLDFCPRSCLLSLLEGWSNFYVRKLSLSTFQLGVWPWALWKTHHGRWLSRSSLGENGCPCFSKNQLSSNVFAHPFFVIANLETNKQELGKSKTRTHNSFFGWEKTPKKLKQKKIYGSGYVCFIQTIS